MCVSILEDEKYFATLKYLYSGIKQMIGRKGSESFLGDVCVEEALLLVREMTCFTKREK